MCLSTVYQVLGADEKLLCQHVSSIEINGEELSFTDIMGGETVVTGKIEKIDLVNNTILVRSEA